jgi:hypothetical protein
VLALVVSARRHSSWAGEGVNGREHAWTVELDHARGGWLGRCSCGWQAKRACWYQARAKRFARQHVEEAERKRWGGLPMGEETP